MVKLCCLLRVGLDFQLFPDPERREREAKNPMTITAIRTPVINHRLKGSEKVLSFLHYEFKNSSRLPHETTTAWRNVRMFSERQACRLDRKTYTALWWRWRFFSLFLSTHTGNRHRPLSTNLIICATLLVPVENGGIIELENKNWERAGDGTGKTVLLLVVALPSSW